ncbi:DUF4233 domain-containing protein [Agromyces sp. LHK192]|uniref:DUF4233 domain-containing protein n=1 Tax=Agromyces sp. LHK192 TaxID=2498704 RepID=UPI000FD7BF19|nr:DUF4233 domain-containing protein [Agromyces sp. LHK192]
MSAVPPAAGFSGGPGEPDVPGGADRASDGRAPRSVRRSLATIVLGFELIVVFLAALVLWGLAVDGDTPFGLPRWSILAVGGAIIVLMLVDIAALLRYDWAIGLGWGIHVLILAAGFINPALFFVGALFGGIWAYAMITGARIDRQKAAFAAGKETP